MKKFTPLASGIFVIALSIMPYIASAQTSTTTIYETTTATATPIYTISTSTATSSQGQILALQTQIIVLLGNIVTQMSIMNQPDPAVGQLIRTLKLAWMSLAQTHITRLQVFLNNGK